MKNKAFHSFLFGISLALLSACTFTKQIKNGETAIDRKQYTLAIELLEEELSESRSKEESARKAYLLGKCYTMINDVDNAANWYDEAVRLDYGPIAYWALANNFKQKESYKQAIGLYQLAGKEGYPANEVSREVKVCRQALIWDGEDDNENYAINPIDANSLYSDYAPSFYEGEYLVFTSDRLQDASAAQYNWTGNGFSDLYIVQKNGGEPLLFDNFLNTPNYNEGSATFSADFSKIFFSRCASDEGDDYCKIMWSIKENGRWLDPQEVFETEPGYNYMHPALIENDSVLIFSTNLPGGEGGYDLFYSLLEEEGWTSPEPMPARLNTMGNESFPTIHGDTLYFSSDYLPGLGGLDIFRSVVSGDGAWSSPVNMKKPLNSGADDFGLIIDAAPNRLSNVDFTGYFTSTRISDDNDNIFKVTRYIPEESEEDKTAEDIAEEKKKAIRIYLAGKVVANDYEDEENPGSLILGKKAVTGSDIKIKTLTQDAALESDDKGRFYLDLIDNSTYDILVSSPGYFNKLVELELDDIKGKASGDTTINIEIFLDKIFVGKEIVLDNIYYDLDKATIRQDAVPALEELVSMLDQNPDLSIQLSAHTDCRGTSFYNLNLSQRRANSVIRYLMDSGVNQERLVAKGFGESSLSINCECDDCTEEEHQTNRRTTFKII